MTSVFRLASGLRGAIKLADPGDHLVDRGTCRAWATIDKPLSLSGERLVYRGHDTGRPRIVPRRTGPGLLILPSVDDFELRSSLTGADGIVIRPADTTRFAKKRVDRVIEHDSPRVEYVRDCRGDPVGTAAKAGAGSRITFLGICPGPLRIEVDLDIVGFTMTASSRPVDGPISRSSSGRPAIKRPGDEPSIIVDSTVDDLGLGFRIHDGFRIGVGVP